MAFLKAGEPHHSAGDQALEHPSIVGLVGLVARPVAGVASDQGDPVAQVTEVTAAVGLVNLKVTSRQGSTPGEIRLIIIPILV